MNIDYSTSYLLRRARWTHEAAGIVVAAWPGTHTPVGTPGMVFIMDFCGECRSCRLGLTNQCLA